MTVGKKQGSYFKRLFHLDGGWVFTAVFKRAVFEKKLKGVPNRVLKIMLNYNWPGYIRQLENLIGLSMLLAINEINDDIFLPTLHITDSANYTNNLQIRRHFMKMKELRIKKIIIRRISIPSSIIKAKVSSLLFIMLTGVQCVSIK